jgi:hypothetical protein
MLSVAFNSKILKIAYGAVLPITVVFLLFGVSSFSVRSIFLESVIADFIIRFMITLWFCGLYIKLSQFSSFSFFPNKEWSKYDVGEKEKYFYVGLIFLFSAGCGLFTFWIIQWFLPVLSDFAVAVAVLNSIIVLLPMATNYWAIKL